MQALSERSTHSVSRAVHSIDQVPSTQYKMCLKAEDLLCQKCSIRKRNHYCIQSECPNKRLLCVPCDWENPLGEHYTHAIAYALPLLTNNVSRNIEEVFEGLNSFRNLVEGEIIKIQNYIHNLRGISVLITQMLEKLKIQKQNRKLQVFEEAMSHILRQKPLKSFQLDEVFTNINFITNQECKVKADTFKKQLLAEVNRLNWLPDPQKLLKDALLQKDESSQTHSEYVFSVTKPIEISEVDTQFREFYEVLTDKLKYNPILIRLENQYSNKTKLYQVLMYHFRHCRKLTIFNASLTQIKTPLLFKDLKELDFICNPDCDSYTLRLQGFSQVTSLKLKKLKEEDTKFLKMLRSSLKNLKQLHLEFVNKYDMAINKDLIQFFAGDDENLRRLVLKLRTENEVKRVYGHFTKFLKEVGETVPTQTSLQQGIVGYLLRHRHRMTKLCLQGVKIVNHVNLLNALKKMPLLFQFRISEVSNPELMQICQKGRVTRRAMLVIQRIFKRGIQHRCNFQVLNKIILRSVWRQDIIFRP